MTMAMASDALSARTSFGSPGFDSDSILDFNFCVNLENHRSSSADELFCNGKLLPFDPTKPSPPPSPPPNAGHHRLPPTAPPIPDHPSSNPANSTNNWRIKRSFSLTCFSSHEHQTRDSFQSTVGRLFRSKSTGSESKVKEPPLLKERGQNLKQASQKRSAARGSAESAPLMGYQRPPLKKRYIVSYSPVINIPSFDLFGFSSVFVRDREKKTSKRK